MKVAKIKMFKIFNISKVWFYDDKKIYKDTSDIIQLFATGGDYNIKSIKKKQYSWILDLSSKEDEIFDGIRKNAKYDINRSIRDDIRFKIYDSKDLKNNKKLIDHFELVYNTMFKEKGMKTRLSRYTFNSYIDNDMVMLSKIIKDDIDIVYHVYLYDNEKTRFLYSCSNFRSGDSELKKIIGRANKYLHWEDIKYFKKIGLHYYDFGGITSFENPNGIDDFKMAFPGKKIEYYNIEYSNTFKGRIYLFLKRIYFKIRH